MGNPGHPARGAVPGFSAVVAERDPHLVHALSREGPDKRVLRGDGRRPALLPILHLGGIAVQDESPVRGRAVAVEPAEQAEEDSVGVEGIEAHGLVVPGGVGRILRIGSQHNVRAPVLQVGRGEPRDLPGWYPVRDGILGDADPFSVCLIPEAQAGATGAGPSAGIDQFAPPIGIVKEVGDFGGEIEVVFQHDGIALGRVLDIARRSQVDESEGNAEIVGLARAGGEGESGIFLPVDSGGRLDQAEVGFIPVDSV